MTMSFRDGCPFVFNWDDQMCWLLIRRPSWRNLGFPHIKLFHFRRFDVPRNQHVQRNNDSMEDINEEEVEELVHPEHGFWGEGGDGVRLGQRQQCGDDKREQVPWEQVPWRDVMVHSAKHFLTSYFPWRWWHSCGTSPSLTCFQLDMFSWYNNSPATVLRKCHKVLNHLMTDVENPEGTTNTHHQSHVEELCADLIRLLST